MKELEETLRSMYKDMMGYTGQVRVDPDNLTNVRSQLQMMFGYKGINLRVMDIPDKDIKNYTGQMLMLLGMFDMEAAGLHDGLRICELISTAEKYIETVEVYRWGKENGAIMKAVRRKKDHNPYFVKSAGI